MSLFLIKPLKRKIT